MGRAGEEEEEEEEEQEKEKKKTTKERKAFEEDTAHQLMGRGGRRSYSEIGTKYGDNTKSPAG